MKYMRGGAVSPDDVTDEDGRMAQVGARRATMGSAGQTAVCTLDGACKCPLVIYSVTYTP